MRVLNTIYEGNSSDRPTTVADSYPNVVIVGGMLAWPYETEGEA